MTDKGPTIGPVAKIKYGRVRGFFDKGVAIFLGIPYGAPTSGKNRFRRPKPPETWTDVRDATDYGARAPQPIALLPHATETLRLLGAFLSHGDTLPPTGEDCLNLNIFTPGVGDGKARPVMVWLHGGGWTAGSANEPEYDGRHLAARGDVVVVGVNHRLGVLGYLHLGELGGESYQDSATAGIRDLLLSLQWVRENIEEFGGDPRNVTIFGESGGGLKVASLLASPLAKGLFERAIIQSGVAKVVPIYQLDDATATASALFKALDIPPGDLDRIHDLPLDELMAGAEVAASFRNSKIVKGSGSHQAWRPIIDHRVLFENPYHAPLAWKNNDVPVIIGTNAHEASIFVSSEPPADKDDLLKRVGAFAGTEAERIVSSYLNAFPELDGEANMQRSYITIMSDWMQCLPTADTAELMSKIKTSPVYFYKFNWASPILGGVYGAYHGLEMPFIFHHLHEIPATRSSPEALPLADLMADTWAAFARTGDPNLSNPSPLPHWPQYSKTDRTAMIFDLDTSAESNSQRKARLAWT